MNKAILGILVLFVALGVGFLLIDEKKTPTPGNEGGRSVGEQNTEDSIKNDPSVQATSLQPVDGSDSSGTGYIVRSDGGLRHVVEASMPDPASGSVYEGWLVQASPLMFFSTGVMQKNDQGLWVLDFASDERHESFNRVVITEETVVDSQPEDHIIEGDF